MALTQQELDQITQIVNQNMSQNNQQLLGQVTQMVQQPQVAPTPAPAPAAYPVAPPSYPNVMAQVNPYDPYQLAQAIGLAQQQYGMNQFGNVTLNQLASYPPNVRDALMQNMMQPQLMDPSYQALNNKIDDLTTQLQWQQFNCQHHSKKKTALKIGGIALGVGGAAYAVHKFKHRHDRDKSIDALTSLGNRYLDAKYGSDV